MHARRSGSFTLIIHAGQVSCPHDHVTCATHPSAFSCSNRATSKSLWPLRPVNFSSRWRCIAYFLSILSFQVELAPSACGQHRNLGLKCRSRSSTSQPIPHHQSIQCINPMPFGMAVSLLHIGEGLALPGFIGRQAIQALMRPNLVVEMAELGQRPLHR